MITIGFMVSSGWSRCPKHMDGGIRVQEIAEDGLDLSMKPAQGAPLAATQGEQSRTSDVWFRESLQENYRNIAFQRREQHRMTQVVGGAFISGRTADVRGLPALLKWFRACFLAPGQHRSASS
jgi:hypothetical protein